MTKKDYILLASAIKTARDACQGEMYKSGARRVAHTIASVLEKENPKFQRDKFMEACGVE